MPYVTQVDGVEGLVVPMTMGGGFSFLKSFPWGVKLKFEQHMAVLELKWDQLDELLEVVKQAISIGGQRLYSSRTFGEGASGKLMLSDMTYQLSMGGFSIALSFNQLCTLREGLEAMVDRKPAEEEKPNG